MRFRSGMIFAVAAVLGLGGCAAAGAAGAGGPAVSPTGRVYEPGTPPTQTQFTRSATVALISGRYDEALAQARQGIEANPENPQHFFIAGQALAAQGNFEEADRMFREAERIYPAYELEVEPEREQAWVEAFNRGVEAYQAADVQGAIAAWRGAHTIYDLRPEAAQNLAILLTQEGQYDEAIRAYQQALAAVDREPATRLLDEEETAARIETRAFVRENLAQLLLFTDQFGEAEALLRAQLADDPTNIEIQANLATALTRLGREAEANQIYSQLLGAQNVPSAQLFNIGVSLFNAEEYIRAAEAFGRVTQMNPNNRDAWYNQANALYAAEAWQQLIPVAQRLVEVDPLNENSALILARAHREQGQNQDALAALQRVQTLPVFLDDLQMRPAANNTTVRGRVIGNDAPAGSAVRVQFTFYGEGGNQLGTETVTVNAPAREQSANFELTFGQAAAAYRYQLAQ
jgi:tetratricopeptide (TPR) repeat protein